MIYLLRHGQDDETRIGGYSNVLLTEEGKEQINAISDYLSKLNIKMIYSSDILRAVQTANIVNEKLDKDIICVKALRELDKGEFTGMKKDYAYAHYHDFLDNIDVNTKYPGGESMMDLYKRIKSKLDYILSLDNSLVVTHRGVINMLYYILGGIDVDMDKERFGVTHASLHELDPEKKLIKKLL